MEQEIPQEKTQPPSDDDPSPSELRTQLTQMYLDKYPQFQYILYRKWGFRSETVEDIIHQTLLVCLERAADGKGFKKNPEAYFRTVMRNLAIARSLKQKSSRILPFDELSEKDKTPAYDADLEAKRLTEEREIRLHAAIGLLPKEKQTIIRLYYFHENGKKKTIKEIAEIMGDNEKSMKMRIHRIRKDLAKLIRDMERED